MKTTLRAVWSSRNGVINPALIIALPQTKRTEPSKGKRTDDSRSKWSCCARIVLERKARFPYKKIGEHLEV